MSTETYVSGGLCIEAERHIKLLGIGCGIQMLTARTIQARIFSDLGSKAPVVICFFMVEFEG